jgi:Na+/melibiose symporter-like transporter
LASGIGPLIGGPVLDIIGLNKGMMPGEVPSQTLNSLAVFIMAWLIPLLLISLWFCNKIDMTADKLAGIQRKIKERDELTNTEL